MGLYDKTSRLPVNQNSIVRPRVDALLAEGIQYPAVVVAAGAGFGKTQAVAGFLDRSGYRSVWFQLTALDNLPMRFWESFLYTVSLHREALGEKLRELGFPDSLYKYHKFLQLLTEALYSDDLYVVFVFDDFQLIHDKEVYQFFQFFVSANLENICLLFITRDLESYSFDNRVYVLTTEDLRFTQEEAAQYFEKQGIPIHDGELGKIFSYTGGWPMALYLVGLQLARNDIGKEERAIHTQQMIFKLIEREIFSGYSGKEQRFFAVLSELSFFPTGLLYEVGGYFEVDAGPLLQNNVLVSYDSRAGRYYLHKVFLDYLAGKRYLIRDETTEDILCKAAEWCFHNAYYVDAIDYYDRCGRQEKVWEVIQSFAGMRHTHDEAELFIQYIEKFPETFMRENPMCRIVYAMLLLNNLKTGRARQEVELVHRQLKEAADTPDNKLLLGESYVGLGLISLGLENFDFVALFKAAARLLPDGSRRWGRKLRLVEYSNALNISSPQPGELEKSVQYFMEGMPYVSKVLHGAGYGLEYLASAEAHFLTGELKQAQRDAYKAMYMAEEMSQADIVDNSLFLLLRVFLVSGDTANIEQILSRLEKNENEGDIQLQGVTDIALGWFYSEIGEVARVAGWIRFEQDSGLPPISVDKESLLRVRCLIEERNYYEALALADKLEKIYRKRNTLISTIFIHIYRAIAHYQAEDTAQAMQALAEAYRLAGGNGFIMPFIEYGHKTRSLLDYARKQRPEDIPTAWLNAVYAKASTYAKRYSHIVSHFRRGDTDVTDYGLTEREVTLLRNMSQGLTRDEIAAGMYLSPNTIKSMLKTVYNKMGAINSADAVRIGISANLI